MSFFGEQIDTDAKEFVERLLVGLQKKISKEPELAGLKGELIPLTMVPSVSEFRSAASKLRESEAK
ncbi:hypothetical protein SAMN05660686_04926 [Thalassobaculum litoreum DSM 18839]|uniref:Uncharacterized protein n=2 Tax=Thalassobaculum TaxID=526215 RepID=A0A8G2BPN0_9PROT|nr:hypothetical protein SAMN05660686_04926 [Thalassobaculum litoreum DSM 18839]